MKLKTLALTVAVLAVLSALAWYLQRPPAAAAPDPRVGQPVFDAKVLDQATQIRLSDQGKSVLLTKGPGGKWVDSSYYDLPADFSKLGHFIDDLSGAKIQRVVSRNPEVLARLEFKDTAVVLLDSGGKELWQLTLGKDAEGGGRFVKFNDETKGYLATVSVFIDAEAKNWADSQLVELKPEDIAAVDVGFADGGSVVATRAKKDEPWAAARIPAGQRLKAESVTSLLSSLSTLRFQDTSDLNDPNAVAARAHSRTVKLTTFDGKTVTITLGRKPEEKKPEPAKTEVSGQKTEVSDQAPTQNAELKTQNSAAAAPEASSQPAAPKLESEGGKPEAGSQTSTQVSEPNPSTVASAKVETQNPSPAKAPAEQTIPAGPVYAFITNSDAAAPINALMKKRAFQVYDWNFTSLPQKPDDLFEPIPVPPPAEKKPETKAVEPKPAETPPAAESKLTTPAREPKTSEPKPAEPTPAEPPPTVKPTETGKP